MTKPSLPAPYPSQLHRRLGEAAYVASLKFPELAPAEIAIIGMLVGEARRLTDGRAAEVRDLDVLAEELQCAGERTGLAEVRDLHAAVVALAVDLDRERNPPPAGFVAGGRRGPAGL